MVATGNVVTFCLDSGSSRVVTNDWMTEEGLSKSLITDQTEENTHFNAGHTSTLNCRIKLN